MPSFDFGALLPYYTEFKTGGLLACAYASGAISCAAAYLSCRYFNSALAFERVAAFCFLASGVLWLAPLLPLFDKKYLDFQLAVLVLAALPASKLIHGLSWGRACAVWAPFAATQFGTYLYLAKYF
ncbi:MAG: hypothetical protein J6P03_05050 [Opitutales bacterium]|nr:hypothetical protein [Opitutales bacterium]